MTPGQQAAIVASAQDWSKAQSVGNPQLRNVAQLQKCNVAPLVTAEERAAQSGASIRTQKMADKVAKADPDLAKKVAHGEISLPKAIETISPKKTKSKDDFKEEVEMSKEEFELIELRESNSALAEENIILKDAISVNQLPDDIEIEKASVIIDDLRKQIKTLEAELSAIKTVRDGLLVENSELKKQSVWQLSQLKKAGLLK